MRSSDRKMISTMRFSTIFLSLSLSHLFDLLAIVVWMYLYIYWSFLVSCFLSGKSFFLMYVVSKIIWKNNITGKLTENILLFKSLISSKNHQVNYTLHHPFRTSGCVRVPGNEFWPSESMTGVRKHSRSGDRNKKNRMIVTDYKDVWKKIFEVPRRNKVGRKRPYIQNATVYVRSNIRFVYAVLWSYFIVP